MNKPRVKTDTAGRSKRGIGGLSEAQGIALAAVLLLLLVITMIGTVSLRMSREQQTMSSNLGDFTRAQFAAEQAVREAIDLPIWSVDPDPENPDPTWKHVATGTGKSDGTNTDYSYTYTIRHKLSQGSVAVDSEGFPYYVVEAEGVSGKGRRQVEVAVISLYESYSIVEDAFIGCQGIPFNANGDLKSYHSDPAVTSAGNKATAKTLVANSDIVIDSSTNIWGDVKSTGNIIVSGNAILQKSVYSNGNILVDQNAQVIGAGWAMGSITEQNSGIIHGGINANQPTEQAYYRPCDPLDIDNKIATETFGISSPGTALAGTQTLTAGNYHFTGSSLSSGDVITVDGEQIWKVTGDFNLPSGSGIKFNPGASLKIYTTHKFSTASNSFFGADPSDPDPALRDLHNTVQKPINLQLYSSAENVTDNTPPDSNAMVNIQSNTSFMGVIYAPKAVVIFNSATDSYGAVRGRWAHLDSNGDFWYDESLSDELETFTTIDIGYKVVYWNEQPYDYYEEIDTSTVASTTTTTGASTTTTTVATTSTSSGASTSTTSSTSTADSTTTTLDGPTFEYSNAACGTNFTYTLTNNSGQSCTLSQIWFTYWPDGNSQSGRLTTVSIGGREVAADSATGTPNYFAGTYISGTGNPDHLPWIESVAATAARTFAGGESKNLSFGFRNAAHRPGTYSMTLRFSESSCKDLDVSKFCVE